MSVCLQDGDEEGDKEGDEDEELLCNESELREVGGTRKNVFFLSSGKRAR